MNEREEWMEMEMRWDGINGWGLLSLLAPVVSACLCVCNVYLLAVFCERVCG